MSDTTERQIFKHIKKKNWTPAFEYSFLSIKKKTTYKNYPSFWIVHVRFQVVS